MKIVTKIRIAGFTPPLMKKICSSKGGNMNVLKIEKLPDGSKKFYFEDGTCSILSKKFLSRAERIAKRERSSPYKNWPRPIVTGGKL